MCDPYLPLERETRLTRRCLEVIDRQGFGVSVDAAVGAAPVDVDTVPRGENGLCADLVHSGTSSRIGQV